MISKRTHLLRKGRVSLKNNAAISKADG